MLAVYQHCSAAAVLYRVVCAVLTSAVSLGGDERGELGARHVATVLRALAFLLTHCPTEPVGDDAQLFHRLLSTLLMGMSPATYLHKMVQYLVAM